ncbi:MAG TPA: MFS transporter [Ktedonobacteraceae bacterium]|nr:MFS transporter [Ktedonobacteraceae bacterium]
MRWHLQGLWKNSDFLKLWLGRTISNMGNGITGIALPLTAVLVLSATPAQMGIIGALEGISVLLFGLIAGVWVDRLRRRPVLIVTDISRALVISSIPAAALLGILRIEQVYIVAALVGILTVFFNAADASYLPGLVQSTELVEGNSKLGISDALAEMVGPAIAGALVQIFSAPLAIVVDAFTFLFSALCMARIRKPEPAPTEVEPRSSVWHESVEGLLFVLRHPLLRALAGSASLFNFTGMFIGTLYTLYVVRTLGLSPTILGLLVATGGLSALAGASVARPVIERIGLGLAIGGGLFIYGLVGLLMPLAFGPVPVVATLLFTSQLVGDAAISTYFIAELSLRQSLIPHHLLGRVNASIQLLTGGMAPLGALIAGIIAEYVGVRSTLFIGVAGVISAGLWLLLSPVSKIRTFDAKPEESE